MTRENVVADAAPRVGLVYENDAHLEPKWQAAVAGPKPPDGVFGRHVANSEFLEAWLRHGRWERLLAVVSTQTSAESISARFNAHPRARGSNRLEVVPLSSFQTSLLKLPLTSYSASSRVADEAKLSRLLERAATGCQLAELDALLATEGAEPKRCRATLAWLLKYDLLRMK